MTLLDAVLSNENRKERQQIVFRKRAWAVIFEDFFKDWEAGIYLSISSLYVLFTYLKFIVKRCYKHCRYCFLLYEFVYFPGVHRRK